MNGSGQINILGIVGSRRREGNTSLLVKEALGGAGRMGAGTSLVMLGDYRIEGCRGCESCRKKHRCVIDDDMRKLYPLLMEADGIILGSPVYFYNVTSPVKAFIERCYCLEAFDEEDRSCWVGIREAMGGGYAALIAVAEQEDERYMGTTVEAMSMPLADLGFRVIDSVKACGLWSPGEASRDHEAMSKAAGAGEKLTRIIKLRKKLEAEARSGDRPWSSL